MLSQQDKYIESLQVENDPPTLSTDDVLGVGTFWDMIPGVSCEVDNKPHNYEYDDQYGPSTLFLAEDIQQMLKLENMGLPSLDSVIGPPPLIGNYSSNNIGPSPLIDYYTIMDDDCAPHLSCFNSTSALYIHSYSPINYEDLVFTHPLVEEYPAPVPLGDHGQDLRDHEMMNANQVELRNADDHPHEDDHVTIKHDQDHIHDMNAFSAIDTLWI